jgi:hypothetical protein
MGAQSPGNIPRERYSSEWRCRRHGEEIGVPGDQLHRQRPLGIIFFPWVICRQGIFVTSGKAPDGFHSAILFFVLIQFIGS